MRKFDKKNSAMTFQAIRVNKIEDVTQGRFETVEIEDLSAGDVVIKSAYSCINYKDALAVTGAGRIMRSMPLVAGIDVSGVVVESAHADFKVGDEVLVTGCGLGEDRDGGYAEYVRAPAESVVALPQGMSLRDAMAIGTAGFTAALAVMKMLDNGQTPEMGPIAVTGATGGVGSVAINILSGLGFSVTAITGKAESADYLRSLGAENIMLRQDIDLGSRPLEKTQWGGAVDNLGGELLSWLTRSTNDLGNVASIGLAASYKLETSVMPFILRGVNLLGINSVTMPRATRLKVWEHLATDFEVSKLADIACHEVAFADALPAFQQYVDGQVTGRTVIRIAD